MKTIIKNIALFIITLGILSSPFSIHAAGWVGPTANPPGNNVSAPVNVGGIYQIKVGDLGVISFFANYIKSLGVISAKSYCFNNGTANGADQNCITSWPAGGTGGGIQSVVAGTNVTVDNTDPANPIVSSTATGGTSGVVVRKDGVPVLAPATTLNFLGSNITTTPSGNSVSISVAPATPTAIRKDGIQVSAAPLALDFTGNNITAQNVGGVVKINVAPTNPTAIQKDGIQVSAAPLAVNFVGDNITATNNGGIVSVGVNKLTVQKDGTTIGAGSNFKGINFNFNGTNGWDIQNDPSGIAQVNYYGDGSAGEFLPAATPADKILRSDGNDWVQSPLVKTTVSSFQVNRPVADNSTDNIFQAAKMYNIFGNAIPLTGLFVTKDGDTYVNGAKFRNYYNGGTTATPTNSFGADDIFQVTTNASNTGSGLAVRGDAKVRVRGELSALNNAVVPLSAGLFLGANDIFHVVGELNGAKKGFGLAVDGTTRVEGILAVNGGQALIGDMIHMGNTTQTGNVNQTGNTIQVGNTIQTGNYTMQGSGATMTLGDTTNAAQLNITGNMFQAGNYNQAGNYSLTGNIIQTGNINTQGRWAMNDSNPPAYMFSWSDPLGFSIPYSFLASVGNNGSLGSIGINRAGQTRINGTMVVNGPANVIGNLAVSGTIKSGALANSGVIDLHVCADQTGTLKICDVPLPQVEILSTTLPGNQFDISYNGEYTPSFPSPSQTTNIAYRVMNATSCSRSMDSGTSNGWISPTSNVGTNPPSTTWVNSTVNGVSVTSFGLNTFKITCENAIGNQASSTITIAGRGMLYYMTPGTYNITIPQTVINSSPRAYLWGAGGGGGGSYWGNYSQNACGAGGAGGAGEYEVVNAIPNAGPAVIVVGSGGNGGNGNTDSGNNPTGSASNGTYGGNSSFSVNGNNMATAVGGGGGYGGGQNNGTEYGGYAGWSGGYPGQSGSSSTTGQCSAMGGLVPGAPFTTGWITGSTNIGFGGSGASVTSGSTAGGADGKKGGFILDW